jgi:D-arabinose 1-dehydrogenase-like Zn-dependent alcohol dehydrogenase
VAGKDDLPEPENAGHDIHGGFATHIIVPSHGLCVVDEHRLAAAGIELADLSVIADAVTTPYQAVVQAGVTKGTSLSSTALAALAVCRPDRGCIGRVVVRLT